ncbi:NAC domain-containing protein 62-like [Gastrolobium bilobum]|uniref:NAC domain-containing protein 62-like n=1 Tax=Gastrolobium bilobum TaxID=150636 RepID=UPI002AB27C41|nr:NAC domain-containing protein 62-like [Gastrolobium bilobum]
MGSTIPILEFMPVGFRFRPTDEELVDHYLKLKLQGDDVAVHIIPDLDLCKVEPWDVHAFSVIKSDDPEWFFFSPPDYKYSNSKRFNRATKCGFWKATGNDRKIKKRGTNNVIGTKKTLVFYEGRLPSVVKTNWVIHEYHATTFDVSQRSFVLCRLMKKAEKKDGEGTDALMRDEGEPSRLMASDCENQATAEGNADVGTLPEMKMESIFQAPLQAENFPSTQKSPIGIAQEASFPNSPCLNAYSRNENSSVQTPFETAEEEDEFLNSILADEDFFIIEERRHAFVNESTQSESLRRVYYESSDTDAEVVSARYGKILDASTVCNEHSTSGEHHASKMFKSSHGAVHGGTRLLSSDHEANKEKKESIFRDDCFGVGTSSCDSTADKPLEINCIEISSSPSTLRRWKNHYYPRPDNFTSQRAATRRSHPQKKVSSSAASHLEAKKQLPIVESEKDKKKVQNTSSRENLAFRSHQSSDVNGIGSFFRLETPSQSLFPRSVYLANVVLGILLLIVISWEALSC